MSLETILEAIRMAGQEQVLRIEQAAQTQVKEILDRAKEEANYVRENTCNEAAAPAFRERWRILHQARMTTLRIIGEARQEFIDTTMERTRSRLTRAYAEADYPAVLSRLTHQAFNELSGSLSDIHRATVEINQRDHDLMEGLLDEMELDLPLITNTQTWGGLIVKSEGDKVVVINTLEARLTSATPYLRRFLAALFENQECLVSTTVTPAYEQ